MDPRVVLITGCSSGIGKALSLAFHAKGYRVIATARRLDTVENLAAKGIGVEQLDVTSEGDITRVIQTVLARERRIDVLVNNAGFGLIGPLLDISVGELQIQFNTNVFGPVHLIQAVAPAMRAQRGGTIINIGSISGIVTTPFAGAYCASKAAVHSLSDAFRLELEPFGIRVICVQPGGIQSNFGKTSSTWVQRIMTSQSWYAPIGEFVARRALESQTNPMSADDLAEAVVSVAASKNPPPIVRLGTRSLALPFLKSFLPTKVLDALFSRRFGLRKLSSTF